MTSWNQNLYSTAYMTSLFECLTRFPNLTCQKLTSWVSILSYRHHPLKHPVNLLSLQPFLSPWTSTPFFLFLRPKSLVLSLTPLLSLIQYLIHQFYFQNISRIFSLLSSFIPGSLVQAPTVSLLEWMAVTYMVLQLLLTIYPFSRAGE